MCSTDTQRKMTNKLLSKPTLNPKSWSALLCLTLSLPIGLALTGCDPMVTVPAPQTQPIEASAKPAPIKYDHNSATQCPTFDPERTMCTMQFDPVCVKIKTPTGIVYKTGSNACSGCMSPDAISYVPGECKDKAKK